MSDGPYRSRYAADAAMSDEDRAAARALSTTSFEKTFPPRRAESVGGDGLHHRVHGPVTDPIEQITRSPHECPAWVRRREKARREIAEHKRGIRIQVMAEQISNEAFGLWCSILSGEK